MSSPGVVWVRRQWNDDRDGKYRLAEVAGWHLSTESGGINQNAPRPFIHAYVQCDKMIQGELAHSGAHGPCPHRIKVCVTKKMNKEFWKEIQSALATEQVKRKNTG